ncbi:hypothetical protein Bca52824_092188 [Brassica carinata]|uniref:Replication factor A C-terminal domain-containing protein n=1 Tax=Brassica carinata TaxID=52824 RepID=A0A8X7TE18_BRACI|nr:hypothetical protein Bca52824_092188 [Brassica carinata]
MKLSGVSDSVNTNGEVADPSAPAKPVCQIGVSSGDVSSGKLGNGTGHGDPGFYTSRKDRGLPASPESWCSLPLNSFSDQRASLFTGLQIPVTICFSWNSVLSLIEELCPFSDDRYRVHGYEEFGAASRFEDYVGHIKLLNGQVCLGTRQLRVREKFKRLKGLACDLGHHLKPKRFGVLTRLLWPSRVFLDNDVEETEFTSAGKRPWGTLLLYEKATAKVAWFECTATIDAVVHGSEWYYIGCAVCHTKATRGPTTLMCKKCGKAEIVGVAHYLSKLSVYDHNDQGVFVLLGDAGEELTGKKAGELVEGYYQANEGLEGDHMVPVPQAMIDTIGQTRKFVVKVSKHNLEAKTQTLTVTKVLPIETPEPRASLGEEVDEEPDGGSETRGEEAVKRGTDVSVPDGVKRARCG